LATTKYLFIALNGCRRFMSAPMAELVDALVSKTVPFDLLRPKPLRKKFCFISRVPDYQITFVSICSFFKKSF
jgi:hypothetical protein